MKKMFKKVVGLVMAAAMLAPVQVPVSANTEGSAEIPGRYQSSEKFSTETADGNWDGGIWSAQTLNPDTNVYTNMQSVVAKASSNLNKDSAESVYSFSDGTNNHSVGAEYITPPTNGRWAATEVRNHWAVKTFVAPKSGFIKITAAGEGIIPSDSSKPKVRVRKSNADGSFTVLMEEKALGDQGAVLNPGGLSTKIDKGESIHFEILRTKAYYSADIYQTEGASHAWVQVYWDPIIEYVETDLTRNQYKSSEFFSLELGNGNWDGGIWSAQYADPTTNIYKNMNYVYRSTDDSGVVTEEFYAKGHRNNSNWTPRNPMVSAKKLLTLNATASQMEKDDEGKLDIDDNTVKAFTAPKDGYVDVTYDAISFSSYTVAKFRIRKQSGDTIEQIYPIEGKVATGTKMTADGYIEAIATKMDWSDCNFTTKLNAGDKLYFELAPNKTTGDEYWPGSLTCDPIVTYRVPDTARTTYRSSDNFGTELGDGYWDNCIWIAQTLNPDTNVYTNMKSVVANANSNIKGSDEADYVYSYNQSSNNHSVGKTHITPPTNGAYSDESVRTHWAVKTFVAPKSGNIKIANENVKAGDGSAPKVRVRKENADGSFTVLMDEQTVYNWKEINNEISTTIETGEKLHFEIVRTKAYSTQNADGTTTYNSIWPKTYWDPAITYTTDTLINKQGIKFKNGSSDVTSFAGIAKAEQLTAEIPAVGGADYQTSVVLVGIYDESGVLRRVAAAQQPIGKNEEKTFSLAFGDTACDIAAGSIRVFMFEDTMNILPICSTIEYMNVAAQ